MTCRVLKLSRQPNYRWLLDPTTGSEMVRAYRANPFTAPSTQLRRRRSVMSLPTLRGSVTVADGTQHLVTADPMKSTTVTDS